MKKQDPRPTDPEQLRALFAAGTRSCEVRRITGLCHSTINYWRTKLGFVGPARDRGRRAELARLHAEGKVDREIAAIMGGTFSGVRIMRQRMGLKAHGKASASFRAKQQAAYRRRCDAAGVQSLRQLAVVTGRAGLRARLLAEKYGLPADLRKVQVAIVVALASGPLTANDLGDRLGRSPHHYEPNCRGYRRFNHAPLPSGNYLTDLCNRGLITRTAVAGREPLWALAPLALAMLASVKGCA